SGACAITRRSLTPSAAGLPSKPARSWRRTLTTSSRPPATSPNRGHDQSRQLVADRGSSLIAASRSRRCKQCRTGTPRRRKRIFDNRAPRQTRSLGAPVAPSPLSFTNCTCPPHPSARQPSPERRPLSDRDNTQDLLKHLHFRMDDMGPAVSVRQV